MPNLEMSVRMAFGTNGSDRTVHLYIEDKTSGVMVFNADLDPDQFTAMMGGGAADVLAFFTPSPERIGRVHQHGETTISAYDNKLPEAEKYAETWRAENGWETVEVRRNNQGQWVIIGRRWVAQNQED